MLHEIRQDGTLVWYCQAREFPDEPPCNIMNTCALDEVSYQEDPQSTRPGRGAVMRLPACSCCGAVMFLKADYTLKELYRETIKYEENGISACALPFRYVYNLAVHWQLYQQGKAAYAPVIDMPPQALLEHPSFAAVKPETVSALWFGYSAVREVAPHELESSLVLQLPSPEESAILPP